MAAYAALLSLMHTINQIKIHPHPPISLDQKQVDPLITNIAFLKDFLERSSGEDDGEMESRIAGAAHAAEDAIETHILDQIQAGSTSHGENISLIDLYKGLERVIQDLDMIKNEVIKNIQTRDHLHRNSSVPTASVRPASTWQSSTMAGFNGVLINEILDKLAGHQSDLQIIPIVGMGGIGKTMLARNIYSNPLIVQRFDILAWITISQEFSKKEILLQVLSQVTKESMNNFRHMSEDKMGEMLYKHLYGRMYLVVMDDMWTNEPWYEIKSFFPDNNNRSRIMITTRQSKLAVDLSSSHHFRMSFLDDDKSWDLLCEILFGKELSCPVELENIGREIARNCRGLPLSIIVIGGLLTKSSMTRGYWEHILENLTSLVNLENDEYCLQLLRTSYRELPMHLKPCFLYMGIFPEDDGIMVSELLKLWVTEGILRPVDEKILEEVAEGYLEELIDRNLIIVEALSWNGKVKICKIHDLLRDLCIREAQKQSFFFVLNQLNEHVDIPQGINTERRICISKDFPQALFTMKSARSLLLRSGILDPSSPMSCRLLRVRYFFDMRTSWSSPEGVILQQINLRYLSLKSNFDDPTRFALCSTFWNLQTLRVDHIPPSSNSRIPTFDIWKLPLLRHAILTGLKLEDPTDNSVLQNLQKLSGIINFKCTEEEVERIPNIKSLRILHIFEEKLLPVLCLQNLDRLQKLESFHLGTRIGVLRNMITFPHSLKKLVLNGSRLNWNELTIKIGSLPFLQLLRLEYLSCTGTEWVVDEGQFCSLKSLFIDNFCGNLRYWTADCTPFPRLEHLRLENLEELEEIPSSIGDIPTLKLVELVGCSESAANSAERIKEEQEDYGNEDLKILIDRRSWMTRRGGVWFGDATTGARFNR